MWTEQSRDGAPVRQNSTAAAGHRQKRFNSPEPLVGASAVVGRAGVAVPAGNRRWRLAAAMAGDDRRRD
jgi:hypothetical protein